MTARPLQHLLDPLLTVTPRAAAISVAAWRDGRTHFLTRDSTQRRGTHPPTTPATRFELGSVTKTFTALLLAESVARKEVNYHDALLQHLPDLGADAASRLGSLTLLHLATHTSGLPVIVPGLLRHVLPRLVSNIYATFHTADLYAGLSRTRLSSPPGTRVHYSNFNIALLGHALTRAAGAPSFPDLLAERVLRPLNLSRTDCSAHDQATGTWHGLPRPAFDPAALAPAGAVRSSAADLLHYLRTLADPGPPHQLTPAPAPSLHAALTDVSRPRAHNQRTGDEVALAWNVRRRAQRSLVFHAGTTHGFTSVVGFSPGSKAAFAALMNAGVSTPKAPFLQEAFRILHELTLR